MTFAKAVDDLLAIETGMDSEGMSRFAQELLTRLVTVTNATGGAIHADFSDGNGPAVLALFNADPDMRQPNARFTLPVARPWSGEILLTGVLTGEDQSLARLAAERFGLALENERLRDTDLRRQTWLTFLAEASELLAQSLDVQLTIALIPRLIVPRLGQWCALYTATDNGKLELAGAAHNDESALAHIKSSLDKLALEQTDTFSLLPGSLDGFTVPLIARGQRLGALAVGRHPDKRVDPDEIAIAEDISRRAALALENARTFEERRRVAQALQQTLLPPELPSIPGVSLGAEYVPTADGVDVGGDFYDIMPMPDGRWLLLVGDVSGKGVQAATVTGLVRDIIRVLVRDGRPLPAILSTLNDTLFERRERHCTLALVAVMPGEEEAEISIYLAGHESPLLLRANGDCGPAGEWGTALGLLPHVTCPETKFTLSDGDTLVIFTDGVTDRRRGAAFFGMEGLRAATQRLTGYPADVVAAQLRLAALDFSNEPPRDDMALLVLHSEGRARA
ncbi:PP2C family protein-serine/threonine phosphatase [Catelliglobosispora koreensis]|uniref:PP2C family protein-serine/threonine phosphatase n=1 Tax=Catelliglobosispora koreensis TaxID=129052 RepID=UPI00035F08FC|nr:GAF domain-containing SpoIIE family protein phosphatase [Catelliglobosispora koreensis]